MFRGWLDAIALARTVRLQRHRGLLKPLSERFGYSGLALRQMIEGMRDWPTSPYFFADPVSRPEGSKEQ